jgi:uncharacterized protein YbjT (DUF2867 family)
MKLVVFGASGATGRHLGSLAAAAGWSVRAFVRSEEARGRVGGAQESVVGDPTDPAVVADAIRGADAVAVCLGISRRTRSPFAPLVSPPDLTSRAVASILQAMQREGVRRIVYVSAYGAGDSWLRIPWWGRAFLRLSKVRYSMADHTRSERLLSGSGTDWTALRPMLLDDTRCAQPARPMRQGDSLMSKVSREALARTVLRPRHRAVAEPARVENRGLNLVMRVARDHPVFRRLLCRGQKNTRLSAGVGCQRRLASPRGFEPRSPP